MKTASVLSSAMASVIFAVPVAALAIETPQGSARAGRYQCGDREGTRFTIVDSGHYRDSSAARGTYSYDLFFGTIVFRGAALDGRQVSSDACSRL